MSSLLRPTRSMRAFSARPRSSILTRHVSSKVEPITAAEAQSRLAKQRLSRPVSPHLRIYKPQITSILSISTRITGQLLSGTFYIFGASYILASYVGHAFDISDMVAWFAALPTASQSVAKFLFAFPFTFHCWNGIRHLVWDAGVAMSNRQVIVTGWIVLGLTTMTSLALTLY